MFRIVVFVNRSSSASHLIFFKNSNHAFMFNQYSSSPFHFYKKKIRTIQTPSQNEEDLDPEDIEFDDHYTTETRSKCKQCIVVLEINCFVFFCFSTICYYFGVDWCFGHHVLFVCNAILLLETQDSEDLDTDTEFEPVEDMTLETRSRCMIFFNIFFSSFFCCFAFYLFVLNFHVV